MREGCVALGGGGGGGGNWSSGKCGVKRTIAF